MSLNNLPAVEFANKDIEKILTDTIAGYEQAFFQQNGIRKILQPGDPIRIFLYSQALREFQLRQLIDFSAKQNLLPYSRNEFLDSLAVFQGVDRFQPTKAQVSVKFEAGSPLSNIQTIPQGTRVTAGNDIYFEVTENTDVAIGETEVTLILDCTEAGNIGNDFVPGQINTLVDPLTWVSTITNIDTSQGGSDVEDDESFRERIRITPDSYSVAGPEGAYIFFARQYSPLVGDVVVSSPSDGAIDVRILLKDGELPTQTFLDGANDYLSDKTRRPLTDHVTVNAPAIVQYNITFTYYIRLKDAESSTIIQSNVDKAVEEFRLWQKSKIERDINPSELIARIINVGAKRLEVTEPAFTEITSIQVANDAVVTVTYGGME